MLRPLSTGDNLLRRNIPRNNICVRCGAPETLLHVLFLCPYATEVWKLSPWTSSFNSSQSSSFQEELQTSHRRINLPPVGIVSNIFPWICWCLWLSRNQLIFESKTLSQTRSKRHIYCPHRRWSILSYVILMQLGTKNIRSPASHWSSPTLTHLKCPEAHLSKLWLLLSWPRP